MEQQGEVYEIHGCIDYWFAWAVEGVVKKLEEDYNKRIAADIIWSLGLQHIIKRSMKVEKTVRVVRKYYDGEYIEAEIALGAVNEHTPLEEHIVYVETKYGYSVMLAFADPRDALRVFEEIVSLIRIFKCSG